MKSTILQPKWSYTMPRKSKSKQTSSFLPLFDKPPAEILTAQSAENSSPENPITLATNLIKELEVRCPKCGLKALASVRPAESGGTHYCPVCQGAEGCYYFTPEAK
jgi:hypothetical protein